MQRVVRARACLACCAWAGSFAKSWHSGPVAAEQAHAASRVANAELPPSTPPAKHLASKFSPVNILETDHRADVQPARQGKGRCHDARRVVAYTVDEKPRLCRAAEVCSPYLARRRGEAMEHWSASPSSHLSVASVFTQQCLVATVPGQVGAGRNERAGRGMRVKRPPGARDRTELGSLSYCGD